MEVKFKMTGECVQYAVLCELGGHEHSCTCGEVRASTESTPQSTCRHFNRAFLNLTAHPSQLPFLDHRQDVETTRSRGDGEEGERALEDA